MSDKPTDVGTTYQDLMYVISYSPGEDHDDLQIVLSGMDAAERVAHVNKLFTAGLNAPFQLNRLSTLEMNLARYATYVLSAIRDSHLLPIAVVKEKDAGKSQWRTYYIVPTEKDAQLKWNAATETADLEVASKAKQMYGSLPKYGGGPTNKQTRKYLLEQLCHYWMHGGDDIKAKTYFTYVVEIYTNSEHDKYREFIVEVIEEANKNAAKSGRYEMAIQHLQPTKKYEPLMRVLAQGLAQNLPLNELQKRLGAKST